jgi:hypothetical protein
MQDISDVSYFDTQSNSLLILFFYNKRIGTIMGGKPEPTKTTLHWVRNVAPKKDMYCISFPLSSELAFASPK